ncbi:MAG: 23S rRNA (guanosine(2251)-2'-O)-methyltransferase RlmB [Clostridia bacterium]
MKIEGRNAVSEALKGNLTIDKLMVQEGINHSIIALARKKNIRIQFVDKQILDKQSESGAHQGFVAFASEFVYSSVEEILASKKDRHFIVILDNIVDPHNLGSILRVCECAGVDGVIIPKNNSVCVNDTVVRVSCGATSYVKVARVTNINVCIEQLKKQNIWVYCAESNGQSMYSTDLTGDIALVIGGEGQGVSRLTRQLCDGAISIALQGKINSLNASVACGIVVYEAVRQHLNK